VIGRGAEDQLTPLNMARTIGTSNRFMSCATASVTAAGAAMWT
jgi:hypothetical protein